MIPINPVVSELWNKRRKLMDELQLYNNAITALQKLCKHPNDQDVSRHGSPDMECPDCGRGMLP